ncbi:MAG: methionyl-tRNA formyltransferase [Deltaproteobacteria bacterium]|jgi:methionyl-tRNA formyltransferase|nr:methionyl-tRNA formyltransferase [Deltaproteobacteria bacterium]
MGQDEPLKLVFMGTPDLAATVLSHLLAWDGGRVEAVYCRPDKPAGRGMRLTAPPVKVLALERGIPVRQPRHFQSAEEVALLRSCEPDYLLVAAYGLILPEAVLAVPRKLALNAHTSLLPRFRGAAPIQRAVMAGDAETGVTIMGMEAGLDTGPIILQETVPIRPGDTAGTLHAALAECGGKLMIAALRGLERGELVPQPQDGERASYAPKLEKAEGFLDFSRPLREVDAVARGVSPSPGAFGSLRREGEEPLAVRFLSGRPLAGEDMARTADESAALPPGGVLPRLVCGALAVRCADGVYLIHALRPAGRKAMDAAAFMNGYLKGRGQARFAPPERL